MNIGRGEDLNASVHVFSQKRVTPTSTPSWSSPKTNRSNRSSLRSHSPTALKRLDFHSMDRIDLVSLEDLLCQKIPKETSGGSTATKATTTTHRFAGLSTRCATNADELTEVADWLLNFLGTSQSQQLSTTALAEIHTFIGLIRQRDGEYLSSQRAYVSAAWISRNTEKAALAASLFRLAKSYGKTGDKRKMRATLQQAYDMYSSSSPEDHSNSSVGLSY